MKLKISIYGDDVVIFVSLIAHNLTLLRDFVYSPQGCMLRG
jgi:hypothetical protein